MFTRRTLVKTLGLALGPAISSPAMGEDDQPRSLIKKAIPSSGEALTAIGMGTWQTFNVGSDVDLRSRRTEVLEMFHRMGGQLIDSSPMYGSSQDVVGYALNQMKHPDGVFSAEKIWTRDGAATREQAVTNSQKWGVDHFDLLQVHNLLSWEEHLANLLEMKRQGVLRYVGITTSHGRRHSELAQIMKTQKLDFVQLTYNIEDREAEQRLLPLAQEMGIAVIINRPFQGGHLIRRLQRKNAPLPSWASKYGCENWPQYLLKFIISHPSVTCAIPATTQVVHMQENMGAAIGLLPSAKVRDEMISYLAGL